MSAWTDLVSKIYKEKRLANANYSLKDAMKDAKKEYKPAPPKDIKIAKKDTKPTMRKSKKNTHNRSSRVK